jgi:hypothetical protein
MGEFFMTKFFTLAQQKNITLGVRVNVDNNKHFIKKDEVLTFEASL